ncbi:MAG: flagellar hook protein FlgE [Gemmatimonadota bacterium]
MMRSLFSGVAGLKNHQVRMDVIGNNVANVNTVAFKSGRVTFKEGFAQLLQGASRPQDAQGGINPRQVGLGMQVGSVDTIFTQGNLETTGVLTDLAVQGDAFFVVSRGSQNFYTRAGNFELDGEGRLVSATNGYRVQGRMATDGVLSQALSDITLPTGQKASASATATADISGNLDSDSEIGAAGSVETSITVYDSQGAKHELKVALTKTAANTWEWEVDPTSMGLVAGDVTDDDGDGIDGGGELQFDGSTGLLTSPATNPTLSFTPPGGGAAMSVEIDFGGAAVNGLTQFAGMSSAAFQEQDGYAAGELQSYSIDRTGTIMGAFSNGNSIVLGQIALAEFNNPGGLMRNGDNLYTLSANSGEAQVGYASDNSSSTVASGVLEMSNVDLTQEFTNMIVAQRGFQANGRVITTTDEMLQEVVNLKR